MSTLAIEIHDAGIVVGGLARAFAPSPGYALSDGQQVLTGAAALAQARLAPRRVDHRFWSELDETLLPSTFPSGFTRADLAHAHLSSIWREVGEGVERVLLTVPGSVTERQLGLVLGIARASGIPVVGVVDASVAACSHGFPGSQLLHVDVELHRAVATELAQGREIVRRRVQISSRGGLVLLSDLWAKQAARAFVAETRFDPLHAAATEQKLYDRMPELLESLSSTPAAPLTLETPTGEASVEVTRQRLVEAAEEIYEPMAQLVRLLKRAGRPSTLLLSQRAAALPGLAERLAVIAGAEPIPLGATVTVDGALAHADAVASASEGEAVAFVTRLPAPAEVAAGSGPRDEAQVLEHRAGEPATHVLHEGVAHPITAEPLTIGVAVCDTQRGIRLEGRTAGISRLHCSIVATEGRARVQDHSTHGSFLNEQRVDGEAELVAGDRLRLGTPGIELLLIRVVDER